MLSVGCNCSCNLNIIGAHFNGTKLEKNVFAIDCCLFKGRGGGEQRGLVKMRQATSISLKTRGSEEGGGVYLVPAVSGNTGWFSASSIVVLPRGSSDGAAWWCGWVGL